MKKRPTIPRLDGGEQVILLVEDVARSAHFYREHLRLAVKDGDGVRYVEFAAGEEATLLIVQREGSIAPLAKVATAGAPTSLTFAITAEAYDPWKEWLVKRGVEIAQEIKWVHGGRSLYALDPDGHRIEFKAPPPAGPSADASRPAITGAAGAAQKEMSLAAKAGPEKPAAAQPKPPEKEQPKPPEAAAPKDGTPPAPAGPGAAPQPGHAAKSLAPPIQGVLETVLYVDDLARAQAFYRDVVGLKPLPAIGERVEAFEAGAARVLLLFPRGSALEPTPAPLGMIPPHDGAGPQHIAFAIVAGDYNAWRAHLRAHGVAIESETGWDRGGRSIYFRDPDRHLVELATPGLWPNF